MVAKSLHMDDLVALHRSEKLRHEHRRFTQAQRKHREMVARGRTCAVCGRVASWSPCCAQCCEVDYQRRKNKACTKAYQMVSNTHAEAIHHDG